jgi:hypothetical protein
VTLLAGCGTAGDLVSQPGTVPSGGAPASSSAAASSSAPATPSAADVTWINAYCAALADVYRPAAQQVKASGKKKRAEYKAEETARLAAIDKGAKRGLANLKLLPAAPVPAAQQALTQLTHGMKTLRANVAAAKKTLSKANPKKPKKFDARKKKAAKKAGDATKTAHPGAAIKNAPVLARAAASAPNCHAVTSLTGGDVDLAEPGH